MIVVSGGGLPGPGYTLIADESIATDVWRALTSQVSKTAVLRKGWENPRYTSRLLPAPAKHMAPELSWAPTAGRWPAFCAALNPACLLPHPVAYTQEGVEPFGADCWEMARVLAGRPKAGAELTEDYNPLEAGLYHACSVTKGCSIGQETINKVGCVWSGTVCWYRVTKGCSSRAGDNQQGATGCCFC